MIMKDSDLMLEIFSAINDLDEIHAEMTDHLVCIAKVRACARLRDLEHASYEMAEIKKDANAIGRLLNKMREKSIELCQTALRLDHSILEKEESE